MPMSESSRRQGQYQWASGAFVVQQGEALGVGRLLLPVFMFSNGQAKDDSAVTEEQLPQFVGQENLASKFS